jgi:hypothetical protein
LFGRAGSCLAKDEIRREGLAQLNLGCSDIILAALDLGAVSLRAEHGGELGGKLAEEAERLAAFHAEPG